MNQPAPFRSSTAARLAAFALTMLTAVTVGCNESRDQPLQNDFATLRSIRNGNGADSIGALDATAPPTNLNDYRHPTRYKINAAYHPQAH